MVETGFITGMEQNIDEWVATFALTQTGSGYKEIIYLICQEEPAWIAGDKVKVYGTASGTFSEINEDGKIKTYPRIDVSFIEKAQ